jgi:hypothetical protein
MTSSWWRADSTVCERLADKISDETGRKVEVIAADLLKGNDVAKVEAVLLTNKRITTLINNARVGSTTSASAGPR